MNDISPQIEKLFAGIDLLIGRNNPVRVAVERSGCTDLELIGGKPWNWDEIRGRSGLVQVQAAKPFVLPVPFGQLDNPEFSYKTLANGTVEITPPKVQVVTKPVAGACQPVGMGVLGILSLASIVWDLLHPRATLILPSEMAADVVFDGQSLILKFVKGPKVHGKIWLVSGIGSLAWVEVFRDRAVAHAIIAGWKKTMEWSW